VNKWDGIALMLIALALGVTFDVFDGLIPSEGWRVLVKWSLYFIGGYLLWYRGTVIEWRNNKGGSRGKPGSRGRTEPPPV